MSSRVASSAFHIPSLDGIRACAFLLVFLGHAGVPGIPAGFGVTVFFFLSGYLITTLLRLEVERSGRIDFKAFYLRRTLRILPPFYLVLSAGVLLTVSGLLPAPLQLRPVLSQALHYSNYWGVYHGFAGIAGGTAVYWSLAVEEHFYAIFPALYALLLRVNCSRHRQRAAFLAICCGVLAWRCILKFYFHVHNDRTYLATDTRLDSMLFGCALAVAGNPALGDRPAKPSSFLKWSLLAAALLFVLSFTVRDDRFRETVRYTMQGIALYPLFYAAVRFPGWGVFRLLDGRLLGFVGKLSYSLYLVHGMVLALLEHWCASLGQALRGPPALAISLGVAWLIWLGIEKPAARLRRRLEH